MTSKVLAIKALTDVEIIPFGVKEQIIFPEISIDKISKIQGMDITFVTSAGTDAEAYELLKAMGMPFASIKK